MNLRSSHAYPWAYDAGFAICGLLALIVALRSAGHGGIVMLIGIIAVTALALLVYGIFIEPQSLHVAKYRETLVTEPRAWVRIVFLSDFHAGGFKGRRWFERVCRETQALHPDLILCGGDFVADLSGPVSELSCLRDLQAPLGKFFVLGNHDYMDRPHSVRAAIASYGFVDLTNGSLRIDHEGASMELIGIDDHWRGDPHLTARKTRDLPAILLSHEPDVCMDLKEGDVDLVLSGHTHGGQIRFPFLGSIHPIPAKLGRSVDAGRKVINGTRLIVSRGLGEQDARARFLCPPEIVLVEVGI